MKKFPFFALTALIAGSSLCLISCNKEEQLPDPTFSIQENFEIPAEGGSFSVEYTVENPVADLTVQASSDSEWINSIDCQTFGTISFTAEGYFDETAPREATVSIKYGEIERKMTVTQSARKAYFTIEVTDIDYTSFNVSVKSEDKDMPYTALVTDRESFDQYTSDQELINSAIEAWKENASNLEMPLEEYLSHMLMKGDMENMTTLDRYPGKEYAIFVFGIDYDLTVLTRIYSTYVTSKTPEILDISYDMSVDVKGADADIHIVPSDLGQSYYLDVITKEEFEEASSISYWQSYFVDNIHLNRLLFNKTPEETMAPNMHTGEADVTFSLEPEKEYVAIAMAASDQGVVFSEISSKEFSTGKVNLSDNVLTISVEIINSTTFHFRITPSNDDPYTWGLQPSSTYEGMSDEEMLEYLLQDPFIGFNTTSGEISSNFGGTPGSTYTVYAFGYQNGTATTDLYRYEFTMPESDDAATTAK